MPRDCQGARYLAPPQLQRHDLLTTRIFRPAPKACALKFAQDVVKGDPAARERILPQLEKLACPKLGIVPHGDSLILPMGMEILDPKRTVAELKELRAFTADEHGAQRVAFTPLWVEVRKRAK